MSRSVPRRPLRRLSIAAGAAFALTATLASAPAQAGSSIGSIDLELNVTNACLVNGATAVAATVGSTGKILFADQSGPFGDVDAQLVGTGGGALSVLCSPGAAPTLKIGAGAHSATGTRHLAAGTAQVAYRLFADAARSDEIVIDRQLTLGTATSSAISVPIYARVNSAGTLLAAGKYTDTVQVTLSW